MDIVSARYRHFPQAPSIDWTLERPAQHRENEQAASRCPLDVGGLEERVAVGMLTRLAYRNGDQVHASLAAQIDMGSNTALCLALEEQL
jgi:hypothetical protein